MSGIGKSIEKGSRSLCARGRGKRGWGVAPNEYKVSFWGDGNVLEVGSGDGGATL